MRPSRGGLVGSSTCEAIPLRPRQYLPCILERYHDIEVSPSGHLADPQASSGCRGSRPRSATSAQDRSALREAAPRSAGPSRREVHPAHRWPSAQEALPVHRHRRLHPDPCALPTHERPPRTAIQFPDYLLDAFPSRSRSSRLTTAPSSKAPSIWHLLDRGHRPLLHPPGHTASERQGRETLTRIDEEEVLPAPPTASSSTTLRPLQRKASGMGGSSQETPSDLIRRSRWPEPLSSH